MSFEAATRIVPALPTAWALMVAPAAPLDVPLVVAASVVVAWVVVVTAGAVVVVPVPPQAANRNAAATRANSGVLRRVIRGTPCDRSSSRDHTCLYDGGP